MNTALQSCLLQSKRAIRKLRTWVYVFVVALLLWFYFCLPKPLFDTPYATVLLDERGELLSARIARDQQWRFPETDSVPIKFQHALIVFEDQYFFSHPGINPVSLVRAFRQNIQQKRVVRGGSTISMQVIRMACNHSSRSVFIKLYEMILALRLELSYSKQEILQLYASHAPYGGNVVGIDAASWRYFNRPAHQLSWGETAALAVLPNAPALVHPGRNRAILLRKRNAVLDKLQSLDYIDEITCMLAKEEPLPDYPYPIPNSAAHLLQQSVVDGHEGKQITSSLQKRKQVYIQGLAEKYARRYYQINRVSNCAILVVDTKTGTVLAYIGNVAIPGVDNSRFVDVITSQRSPGSVLKPFLYAAMISDGTILPHQLVADIPTSIGGYRPENFEKNYVGAVPASTALAHSLNIPAVRMLQEYGVEKFHAILQRFGFTTITQHPQHYGLSLILGGAEVRMWDAVSAYASMGRALMNFTEHGEYTSTDYRAIQYITKEHKGQFQDHSVVSAGALYECFTTLASLERPWGEIGWDRFASSRTIAWKTGTSYGHRDAWSIGVTPQYTVGVWVGNASGEGRPGLTGLQYAAPLMFDVFSFLQPNTWFEMPQEDMTPISICIQSGMRALELCDARTVYVPKSSKHGQACAYHQRIFLDSTRRFRVSSRCYSVYDMVDTAWFIVPPIQAWYMKQNSAGYSPLPPFMNNCNPHPEIAIDVIVPERNAQLIKPVSLDETEAKYIFEAVHSNPSAQLFWHINNEFVGISEGIHKIEYTPVLGAHTLTIVDESGNVKQVSFSVIP